MDSSSRNPEKAKRCLFGPPDHEQTRRDLEEETQKDVQEKREKWNFDFENATPLSGRYKWEKVESSEEKKRGAEASKTAKEKESKKADEEQKKTKKST